MENDTSIESQVDTQVETTTETVQDDYSYVPSKFLEDGKPNFQKMAQSYTELEKHLGSKAPAISVDDYDFNFQQPDSWDMEQYNSFREQAKELGVACGHRFSIGFNCVVEGGR